jgi:hypothetical protein
MRWRLAFLESAVVLCIAAGAVGCRPPVGVISSVGRAGAAGATASRISGTLARAGSLGTRTAARAGARSLGRVAPRVNPAEIDGVLARGATVVPKTQVASRPDLVRDAARVGSPLKRDSGQAPESFADHAAHAAQHLIQPHNSSPNREDDRKRN